jgi:hypothetical protein
MRKVATLASDSSDDRRPSTHQERPSLTAGSRRFAGDDVIAER